MCFNKNLRIGIHCSTSGSLEKAAIKANELGANCLQIFSSSPRMWFAPQPDPAAIKRMADCRAKWEMAPLVIHDNYLINLAASDLVIRKKSINAFRGEVERAIAIGAEYLVMHPGSAKGYSTEEAITTFTDSIIEATEGLSSKHLQILFENTAGQGSVLGSKFEELAELRRRSQSKVDFGIGYCIDTCHCYASGYDVATAEGLKDTVAQAGAVLGFDHIPVIHTNDSKGALNSHLDRHANIGEGYIGLEGFRRILSDKQLKTKAFVLETPIDNDGDDLKNVETLKSLCRKRSTSTNLSS